MKLYVWHGVLYDYTSGIMFAYAENVPQAVALLIKDGIAWKSFRSEDGAFFESDGESGEWVVPECHESPCAVHLYGGG